MAPWNPTLALTARVDADPTRRAGCPWRRVVQPASGSLVLIGRWDFEGDVDGSGTATFAFVDAKRLEDGPASPKGFARIAFDFKSNHYRHLEAHTLDAEGKLARSSRASLHPPYDWKEVQEPQAAMAEALHALLRSDEVAWPDPAPGGPEELLWRLRTEPHRWMELDTPEPAPTFLVRDTLYLEPDGAWRVQLLTPDLEPDAVAAASAASLRTYRIRPDGRAAVHLHGSSRGRDLRHRGGFTWYPRGGHGEWPLSEDGEDALTQRLRRVLFEMP